MLRPSSLLAASFAALALLLATAEARAQHAAPTAVIVVDGSGSMWGNLGPDKRPKIEMVREALRALLPNLRTDARVGLTSFGHRRRGNCGDAEVIVPPEADSAVRMSVPVEKMNAMGKAPVALALRERSDLLGARATEKLAFARIEQARAEGRIDASLTAGYQRMNSGFPLNGIDDAGQLRPIQSVFNFFTFGVEIDLPVRNRNQGMIEAATFEREAAQRRIEFGELTVRREVNTAFARYNRAARAFAIFQNGVRDQANANLSVVWQTYELGRRNLSDYIAEQRRFLEIENELIDAMLETYQSRVEILRATNAPELIKK